MAWIFLSTAHSSQWARSVINSTGYPATAQGWAITSSAAGTTIRHSPTSNPVRGSVEVGAITGSSTRSCFHLGCAAVTADSVSSAPSRLQPIPASSSYLCISRQAFQPAGCSMRAREMQFRWVSPLAISATRCNERNEMDCWFLLKAVCRITKGSWN